MTENNIVEPEPQTTDANQSSGMELAIIGMAGQFPGAHDIEEFWQNLVDGKETISFFTDEEVLAAGVDPKILTDPHYIKAGGTLENIDLFDAGFFNVYPKEAAIMDPQHRLFLEKAWEALEDAGYNPEKYSQYIGVYAGMSMNTYLVFNLVPNREVLETVLGYQLTIANDKDFLPTRVAYKLNLKGPAVNIQTACSTSLVATHLACQGLLSYQCDMALAGGISVRLPQRQGYLYQEGGIQSADGHCRPFDAQANGTVSGNGVGVVVLKRLADALCDGDHIYAVIKGSAINNDGSLKVGYTAPSVEGQADVISMAQVVANVDPSSIQYVETHGTGTSLGDPIEVAALTQVYRNSPNEAAQANGYCAIGSVKANIGHLDAAAGVAGLIKTALALNKGVIPPSINYSEPNPKIDFAHSPFYVNSQLTEWKAPAGGVPRRAAISSFGIGGTNAHMILEEAPVGSPFDERTETSRPYQLLTISARSGKALETGTDRLVNFIKRHPDLPIGDVAYTLKVGRKAFSQRRMAVVNDLAEAAQVFENRDPLRVFTSHDEETLKSHPIVFMFPGQGAQYINMGRGLYEHEPVFREQVDLCARLLMPHLSCDLRDCLFSDGALEDEGEAQRVGEAASQSLMQTSITQPALFVIEYALAKLLMSWGIRPEAMIGHSIGEYVAACIAGVFSLEDVLKVVATRGSLMQSMPPGAMISIPLPEKEVSELLSQLPDSLSISAINTPALCVVSGPVSAVDELVHRLANQGIEYRRLRTSHAFHSVMMDPILAPFTQVVSSVKRNKPQIPFISNLSGTWIKPEEAMDTRYWTQHLRQCVCFSDGIAELLKDPAWIFLEVGPGQTLSSLAKGVLTATESQLGGAAEQAPISRTILSTIRHPRLVQDDEAFLLTNIGRLWLMGVEIDWQGFYQNEQRKRVSLPTYPFERQRFWIEPDYIVGRNSPPTIASQETKKAGQIRKNPNLLDWIYTPGWKREVRKNKPAELAGTRWLFIDPGSFGGDSPDISLLDELGQYLLQLGAETVPLSKINQTAGAGAPFEQYSNILKTLIDDNLVPTHILFMSALADDRAAFPLVEPVYQVNRQDGLSEFNNLLALIQALVKHRLVEQQPPIQVEVITCGAFDVLGDETINPSQAALVGLARVVNQEYPHLDCRVSDLLPQAIDLDGLIEAITALSDHNLVAHRGRTWWTPVYDRYPLTKLPANEIPARLRQNGVYLITGGLGRIGLVLAQYLAQTVQARLILVDRIALPARSEWLSYLDEHPGQDATSQKIRTFQELEKAGALVMLVQAEVSDRNAMQAALQRSLAEFGTLNGIIHAAGLVGERAIKAIQELEASDWEAQFIPKVDGLLVLADLCRAWTLDFVFLQSSLSAVLGGLGLGAYAAANLAMDAWAANLNRLGGTPWLAIDWDGWRFNENVGRMQSATIDELSLTPEEGVQVFAHLMSITDVYHLVVSTADLAARLERWVQRNVRLEDTEPAGEVNPATDGTVPTIKTGVGNFPRPNLQTPYIAPRNDLEQEVTQVWQKILGISPIGVYDDFFELGGHSLLATQLVSRIRDKYHVELPLRKLFETPNIAGLVAQVKANQADGAGQQIGLPELPHLPGQVEPPAGRDLAPSIPRIPIADLTASSLAGAEANGIELEASFGQQRLWFLDQLEPDSPLYNNFAALRLSGTLDMAALEFSLGKIIERHEALRTIFRSHAGTPRQVILPVMATTIQQIDLSQSSGSAVKDTGGARTDTGGVPMVTRLALDEARRPFNLSTGPLLRMTVLHLTSEEHIVFLTMHHIISDGWSVGVLIKELGAYYTAYLNNPAEVEDLPDLPIQYADYAAWQRQYLTGEVLERQLAYWRDQLADAPASLNLFTDRPRPAVQSNNGASLWFELPEATSAGLIELCQREGVTLFMALLAALQTLLYRYTSQEIICVGTPIANRNRIETEGLIGFLLNTLVLKTDLSGNPSFKQLLKRVRETALGAYAHQDLPFEMLVDELKPQRDMSRSPFFQVIFDLQVSQLQPLQIPGLSISTIPVDSGTTKFDLAVSMEEIHLPGGDAHKTSLRGYFNYNTDLFDPATIERMVEHWQVLLSGILEQPETSLSNLPLLTQAEWQQIVVDWNRTDPEYVDQPLRYIHQMIEAQAEAHPDRLAVVFDGGQLPVNANDRLTYGELNHRANQLARYLVNLGVGPEVLVGVCLDRSLEMVVGILAVIKAGGAFLPLDPAYPPERLAFMLADAQVHVLLTQDMLVEALQLAVFQAKGVLLVRLDADWPEISKRLGGNQVVQPPASDPLAYVIYTSGSTGKPKGVMITQAVFAKHCRDMVRRFNIQPEDRVLQFASINFDAALEQLFTTLISGAQLVMRGNEIWSAAEFHRKVAEYHLTVVNIPPAYWSQWTAYLAEQGESDANGSALPSIVSAYQQLKLVIIGGDVMPVEVVNQWQKTSLHHARLLNAYGPTETTITAATFDVPRGGIDSDDQARMRQEDLECAAAYGRVPIGRPHAFRKAYILDPHGNPVPTGVPGELNLGGAYLSRGYLNQPELTSEKFVPDPFTHQRMYKTGDLARFLPHGHIDFLGRVDQQVKLRGFRIELGEIEANLLTYPGISQVVVIAREPVNLTASSQVEKQLVAYCVPQAGQVFDIEELQKFLKARLPVYMVPAAYVILDALPLTPSGKIDRQSLPVPEQISLAQSRTVVAPRSPIEQALLGMWAEVLHISLPASGSSEPLPFGVTDNFFSLGGHSLLATQLISRIFTIYNVELPLRSLFENPTIAALAAALDQRLTTALQDELLKSGMLSEPGTEADLESLLAELDRLSDEEARRNLSIEQPESKQPPNHSDSGQESPGDHAAGMASSRSE